MKFIPVLVFLLSFNVYPKSTEGGIFGLASLKSNIAVKVVSARKNGNIQFLHETKTIDDYKYKVYFKNYFDNNLSEHEYEALLNYLNR
jgi:hypothetical protein